MIGSEGLLSMSKSETEFCWSTRMLDGYPIKYVNAPSIFLHCSICKDVYYEPVILITCGHTYCKKCTLEAALSFATVGVQKSIASCTSVYCPADKTFCSTDGLVPNKTVQSQIDDLDIYCRNGLIPDESGKAYLCDSTGCQVIIKLGERLEHERNCQFAWLACHAGGNVCGSFRRKDYQNHVTKCTKLSNNSSAANGDSFINGISEVQDLKASQNQLTDKVKFLEEKVKSLEARNISLTNTVENCHATMKQLVNKNTVIEEKLSFMSQQLVLRHKFSDQPSTPNSENRLLKFGSRNSSANLNALSPAKLETWEMPFQFKCIGTFRGHNGGVWCLQTWQTCLFSAGTDCVIKVWDLDNPALGCRKTIAAHQQRIHTMAVGQKYLYTAGDDLSIKSWHLNDVSEHLNVPDAHEQNIAALICVNQYLFSSSFTIIKVWNCETLELMQTISGLYHWVRSLACNPIKDKLYSGSHGTINIWNVSDCCSLAGKISHSHGSVHSLAITNKYIIAGTYNNNTHIFDVTTLQHVHHLTGHVGVINCLIVSPSGRFMFSGSSDSSVMVWSLEKMLPIMTLQRHNDSVSSVVINGDHLLTGSEDTEIKVFKHFRMHMGFQPT